MEQLTPDDILFVGDVHLGRRPVGLDDVLAAENIGRHELSPAAALRNLVDHALDGQPRAVVFAGDLVDQDEDRFEAYSILEREVRRLREEGVPVLAVAGNHDGLVLPRLIERVEGVQLLGEGGVWQRCELAGAGRPVDLLGWSFPTRHVRTCPLDHASFARAVEGLRPEAVGLGVLHGDLGATSSNYAPIPRARLEQTELAAWFLGHVHAPGDLSADRPIGYLGSLCGLHSNETGPRGPWRARLAEGGVRTEQVPLAPVRWESLQVTVEEPDALDADALHAHLEAELLRQLRGDTSLADERLRVVVARVRLTGRIKERGALREFVERHEPQQTVFYLDGTPVIVERVTDATRPAIDLEDLAREPTAPGHVARQLLALGAGQAEAVVAAAHERIAAVTAGGWRVDDELHPLPTDEQLVERAAWRVLETLLEQRGEADRE